MARSYIPESLEELTPEFLTGALREGGSLAEATVTEVETEVLGVGQGFIGDVARLTLRYDRDEASAPRTLIVKLPTSTDQNRGLGNLGGMYEREIRFYRELRGEIGIRTPAYYYSAMDETAGARYANSITRFIDRLPGILLRLLLRFFTWLAALNKRRFLIMLEDMAPARLGDQVAGCSSEDAAVALRDLARLHAQFWNDPRLEELWWIIPLDLAPNIFRHFIDQGREPFLAQYADRLTPAAREKLAWLECNDLELMRRMGGPPFTIVHGDFRLDNMFFDAKEREQGGGDEIVLFDWQGPGRGLGAFDVAYFLSASLPLGTPPEAEQSMMRLYHDELAGLGVKDYPWEQFERDYRLSMLLMLERIAAAAADIIELGENRGRELMETWTERLLERVETIRTDDLL